MVPDPEPVLLAADAWARRDPGTRKSALTHPLIQEPGVRAGVPQPVRGLDCLWAQSLSWGKGGGSLPPSRRQGGACWRGWPSAPSPVAASCF